jgi:PAS domain S-box-containing protein
MGDDLKASHPLKRIMPAVLPAILCVALFAAAVFLYLFPQVEQIFIEQKKATLKEVLATAWTVVKDHHRDEISGAKSRQEAQQAALAEIGSLRYGPAMKDYIWVTDLRPFMIMHPYRADLNHKDLSNYQDRTGKRLFVLMAQAAKTGGDGFESYYWQLRDDPQHIGLKHSYFRIFEPWGWVLGTGFYQDEATQELKQITGNLSLAGLALLLITCAISGYAVYRNIMMERERTAALTALKDSEEKFRGISAGALDGIVMLDPKGRVSWLNQAAEKMFGYTQAELLGEEIHQLLAPERYRDRFVPAMREFSHSGRGPVVGKVQELYAKRKEGLEFPVELSVSAIKLQGKWHAVGIVRDITKRKQAMEDLRQSRELFALAFDASPLPMIISRVRDRKILQVNQAFCQALEYEAGELIGNSSPSFGFWISKDDPDRIRDTVVHEGYLHDLELNLRTRSGKDITALARFHQITLDGEPCILGAAADITERKNAEKMLLKEQKRLVSIFDGMDIMVTIVDPATDIIIFANQQVVRLFGRDIVGETCHQAFFSSDEPSGSCLLSEADRDLSNSEQREFTCPALNRDLLSSSRFITWPGEETVLMTVFIDITERNQVEKSKEELEAKLRQAQKMEAIGTLAGGIAHDFNNLLTVILGFTQVALKKMSRDYLPIDELGEVEKAGLRAREIVGQILTYSRQASSEKRPIDLTAQVSQSVKLIRATLQRSIELSWQPAVENATIIGNNNQINQVVMNLVINAAHAIGSDRGQIDIQLAELTLYQDDPVLSGNMAPGRYYRLLIKDNGPGIQPQHLERLFEPFFTTKNADEGTGLGLSVVQGIVKDHGGELKVESKSNEYTKFMVYLPKSQASGVNEAELSAPPESGRGRILLVDDDSNVLEVTSALLIELGYEVTAVAGAPKALELFEHSPLAFDLVLSDYDMPRMNGLELAHSILDLRPGAKLLLISGLDRPELPRAAREAGVLDVLFKPLSISELAKAIKKHTGSGH